MTRNKERFNVNRLINIHTQTHSEAYLFVFDLFRDSWEIIKELVGVQNLIENGRGE